MSKDYLNSPGFNLAFPNTIENETVPAPEMGPTRENSLELDILNAELELAEIEYKNTLRKLGQKPYSNERNPVLEKEIKKKEEQDERIRWSRITKAFTTGLGEVADEVVKAGREALSETSMALGGMQGVGPQSYTQDTRELTPLIEQESPIDFDTYPIDFDTYLKQSLLKGGMTPEEIDAEHTSRAFPLYDDPMINLAVMATGIGTSVRALRAAGYSGKAFMVELAKEIGDWVTGLRSLKNIATAPIKAGVKAISAPRMEAMGMARTVEDIYKLPVSVAKNINAGTKGMKLATNLQPSEELTDIPVGFMGGTGTVRGKKLTLKDIREYRKMDSTIEEMQADEAASISGLNKLRRQERADTIADRRLDLHIELELEAAEREAEAARALGKKYGLNKKELQGLDTREKVERQMRFNREERIRQFNAFKKEYSDDIATAVSPKIGKQKKVKAVEKPVKTTTEATQTKTKELTPQDLAKKYNLIYKGREQQGLGDVEELKRIYGENWKQLTDEMLEQSPHHFVLKSDPTVNVYIKPGELTEANLANRLGEVTGKFEKNPTIGITAKGVKPSEMKIMSGEEIIADPEEAMRRYMAAHPESRWQGGEAVGAPTKDATIGTASANKGTAWSESVKAELQILNDDPERGLANIDPVAFYNGLRLNWIKSKETVRDTLKEMRELWRSPEFASKNRFYKEAYQFHHKNWKMKQWVTGTITHSFAQVDKGLNVKSQERIFDALEKPHLVRFLTNQEHAAYEWTKKFYKSYFDLFIELKAGDKAPLIRDLAKLTKGQKVDLTKLGRQYKLSPDELRAFEVARRESPNYTPHIFNRFELKDQLEKRLVELKALGKDFDNPELSQISGILKDLNEGKTVSTDFLPQKLQSKFFEKRVDLAGYQRNNREAVFSWLKGFLREVYDGPALQLWAKNIPKMDELSANSAKILMRDYLGLSKRSPIYATMKNMEYSRIFGLNLSSAAVNLLQQINTIADAPVASMKAYKLAFTPTGNRLWQESGLAQTAYEFMSTGDPISAAQTKIRGILGVFHNIAEIGNKKHAYLTYLIKGSKKFDNFTDAHFWAVDKVGQTQFFYDPLHMPRAMRGKLGVATQFWSYPLKSVENVISMCREKGETKFTRARKLLSWVALYEGGQRSAREYLDLDLSNQLGFPIDFGEAFLAIREASDEDLQAAKAHLKMVFRDQGGLMPNMAPTVDLIIGAANALINVDMKRIRDKVAPVTYTKMAQFHEALKYGSDDRYPLYPVDLHGKRNGSPKYFLTLRQLINKTFFFKPNIMSEQQKIMEERGVSKDIYYDTTHEYAVALAQGNFKKIDELLNNEHLVIPGRETFREAYKAELFSPTERLEMERRRGKMERFHRSLFGRE